MLSARELSAELPAEAQTWVNQKLQFTHGYGLVMSFVSKTMGGGFPQYILKDIPPDSSYGLPISQPAIYYGASMPGYRIVATGIKELDYPKGNENVYTSYAGTGGIPPTACACCFPQPDRDSASANMAARGEKKADVMVTPR